MDPDRTVTISEETSEQTQPGDPNAGTGGSSSSNTVTNYETSKSIQRIVEGVGNIDRISVAVMVNNKPDVKTDPDGNTETTFLPRDAQEMQQLEQLVKMAVGFDNNRSDQFSIVNMQFDPSVEEDLEVMPWWGDPMDIIEKVVIGIALLMGIFLVRSILTSAKSRGDEIQSQIQQILEEEKDKDVKAMKSAEHNHALSGGEQEDDEASNVR
ncbi:MAG: flagellar M-ring protein FliF C-terminal domain-containing protein [Calditrichia bacterium]